MSLEQYHSKRDFSNSPEPFGQTAEGESSHAPTFVIQKHDASRLHYDFRLELDGVYKSWAVPKGPSLDTHDRRLAVHVEDHPLDYGSFEGTIPKGEYGGGTVMVWDRGTYEPNGDIRAGFEKGDMKFVLHGEKLQGGFALVRMKPREGERGDNWLLIKERDEFVRPREEYDVTQARPDSVASGRDLAQIAEDADDAEESEPDPPPPTAGASPLPEAHRLDEPAADIPMQLAQLSDRAPEGDEWIHEVKYDGYRVRAILDEGSARMLTRSGQDWTDRFEPIAREVARLPVSSAIIDGEVVVLGDDGVPDFAALQHALGKTGDPDELTYMAFDLLSLDGWDLRDEPLAQRKELLRSLLDSAEDPSPVRFADYVVGGSGEAFHEAACDLSLEGSVSKRADRPYRPGRSDEWRKVKCLMRQEFVVGGYTEPGGSRHGFGALLLGVYRGKELVYAGRVGTGFTESDLGDLSSRLEALAAPEPAFADAPEIPGKQLHWVRPELVVEVRFQEWTPDGVVRHPSYVGLRQDKPAEQVVREGADAEKVPPVAAAPLIVAGIAISNPDKELFASLGPSSGRITKLDLVRYYEQVADAVLEHLRDRPLTLVRCPSGHAGGCFYQKHPDPKGTPAAVHTTPIVERDGTSAPYGYVDDAAGLVALAQLGVLEIHAWNSHIDDVEHPDRIVFDLDPGPGVEWLQLTDAARLLRESLGALGLTAFLKLTGGKGLHLVVPIEPEHDYDTVRGLAHAFVDTIATHDPEDFTAKMSKSLRPGRVFLDYLRNAHGATAVTNYSTRARAGAPVSVPIRWEELDVKAMPIYGMDEVIARLAQQSEDPWAGYERSRKRLGREVFDALGVGFQGRLGGA